jgi:hypothetical protein
MLGDLGSGLRGGQRSLVGSLSRKDRTPCRLYSVDNRMGRVADYQKRSVVAVQQVPAILNSFAATSLCHRVLRGLIVGEAVVTLATPEYCFSLPFASLTRTR